MLLKAASNHHHGAASLLFKDGSNEDPFVDLKEDEDELEENETVLHDC